jgi:hypothetical protein
MSLAAISRRVAEKGTVLQSLAISHQQRQGKSSDHLTCNKKPTELQLIVILATLHHLCIEHNKQIKG